MGQILSPLVEHPPDRAAIAGTLGAALAIADGMNCHHLANEDGERLSRMQSAARVRPTRRARTHERPLYAPLRDVHLLLLRADRCPISACTRERTRLARAGAPARVV